MAANSVPEKPDTPWLVFDKSKDEWFRKCRLCGGRLELDEEKRCYRHKTGTLLNNLSPSKFPHCEGEQWLLPEERREINNKRSHKKRDLKKQAKIDLLNSLNAEKGKKQKEKVNGRYRKTRSRMKKSGETSRAKTPTNENNVVM